MASVFRYMFGYSNEKELEGNRKRELLDQLRKEKEYVDGRIAKLCQEMRTDESEKLSYRRELLQRESLREKYIQDKINELDMLKSNIDEEIHRLNNERQRLDHVYGNHHDYATGKNFTSVHNIKKRIDDLVKEKHELDTKIDDLIKGNNYLNSIYRGGNMGDLKKYEMELEMEIENLKKECKFEPDSSIRMQNLRTHATNEVYQNKERLREELRKDKEIGEREIRQLKREEEEREKKQQMDMEDFLTRKHLMDQRREMMRDNEFKRQKELILAREHQERVALEIETMRDNERRRNRDKVYTVFNEYYNDIKDETEGLNNLKRQNYNRIQNSKKH